MLNIATDRVFQQMLNAELFGAEISFCLIKLLSFLSNCCIKENGYCVLSVDFVANYIC